MARSKRRGPQAGHRRSAAAVGSLDPSVFTPEDIRVANLRRLRSADQFMMTLLDVAAALRIGRGTLRKMRQNLGWAVGYNLIALPIAAGVFEPSLVQALENPPT